jgi:hypothetical protein
VDLKQKILEMAREATGDDEIQAAGDFQPKGLTWKRAAGAAAGSLIGGAIDGDVGQSIGTIGGVAAGTYAGTSGELPPVIIMAASPSKLYLLTSNNAKGIILAKHLILMDTLDRDHLVFEFKQRVTTRTVVVTDESTGHEYKMEGKRILFHHMNDVLDLLGDVGGKDAQDEEAEHEAALAAQEAATG